MRLHFHTIRNGLITRPIPKNGRGDEVARFSTQTVVGLRLPKLYYDRSFCNMGSLWPTPVVRVHTPAAAADAELTTNWVRLSCDAVAP